MMTGWTTHQERNVCNRHSVINVQLRRIVVGQTSKSQQNTSWTKNLGITTKESKERWHRQFDNQVVRSLSMTLEVSEFCVVRVGSKFKRFVMEISSSFINISNPMRRLHCMHSDLFIFCPDARGLRAWHRLGCMKSRFGALMIMAE